MERFGEAAARLCNAAAVLLGWKPAEFWDATPAELALVLEVPPSIVVPDGPTIEALKQRFPDQRRG